MIRRPLYVARGHGADGLRRTAKFSNDPARNCFSVSSSHAAEAEIQQNLGAMPSGASPAEIVTGQFVGWDADLLELVFGRIVRDQCAIVSEISACAEKLKLRG